MGKFLIVALLLCAALTVPVSVSLADEDLDDPNLRVSEGLVTAVDTSRSTISVDAGILMVFAVSRDTKLRSEAAMYSTDIKLSDIGVGDNVTVEYLRKGKDSRTPAKVIRITVENKAGGNN